ncbi:transposase [Synechococcus sp. RedBA-s]|uniref:transposase n=1 Tax=Synechococcus sp. RedBA-s TaxID=2823741 RepID=UPI0020CB8285|nr:transposase [Synechococcus sp. RedBA-s]MCP9801377.1 transposase [Synechococcus sp. RedBA-s]
MPLNEAGPPSHAKITAIDGFSSEAIVDWASSHLAPGSELLSDGLACFRAAATADYSHEAVVTSGKQPNDLPEFRWINS